MNRIRQILNNRICAVDVLYAVLFALMTVLSRHTVYSDAVESNILTVYVSPLRAVDIIVFPVTAVIIYLCLQLIRYLFGKIRPYVFNGEDKVMGRRKAILWIVIFAVIMICYIPYMMSFWPGGIYNDTCDTIDIALGRSAMSDQNTVLYALFWKLIFGIGRIFDQGDYGGLKLMTVLQCAAVAGVAAGFVTWLRAKGLRKWVAVMLTAATALFPIFPYYGISLWKETWFGLEFFIYTLMWLEMAERLHVKEADKGGGQDTETGDMKALVIFDIPMIIMYIMSTMLIVFGRNNGLYVVLFVMVLSLIMLRKALSKSDFKRLFLVNITIVVLALAIKGPVYRAAGIKSSSPAESLGIPLQQTAYMISGSAIMSVSEYYYSDETADSAESLDDIVREGLSLSDSEYKVITSVMPLDAWVNVYNPVVVDSIKFSDFFDKEYFDSHTGDFLRTYAGIVLKNPKLAMQGYLLSTMGFWDAYKSSSSAYICTAHTAQAEYFMSDYFNSLTDKYLSDIVGPRWYMSGGALVWIMLGLLAICMGLRKDDGTDEADGVRSGGKKDRSRVMSICVFLPGVGLWLTYMLATPLSFSFRYLFGLLLCIPIYIITCIKKAQS